MSGNKQGTKPVKWNENKIKIAYFLALMGCTDTEMAEVMEVSIHTINLWKRERPEFTEALTKGKIGADVKVLKAFYKRATGYHYKETEARVIKGVLQAVEVEKYMHPDPWSAARWLSLRQKNLWSEAQKIEFTQNNSFTFNTINLSTEDLLNLESIAKKLGTGTDNPE